MTAGAQKLKARTVHFFDVEAVLFDPENPKTEHPANIDALWRNLRRLVPLKGHASSSFLAFWGQEMVVAIDHDDDEKVYGRSAKVRRDALPGILKGGAYGWMKLEDDEYLYETSHFVFFKRTNVMAIEYSQHAPGYKYLEQYLNSLANSLHIKVDQIRLKIKLGQNTVKRLMGPGSVVAVEVAAEASEVATLPSDNRLTRGLRGVVGNDTAGYVATVGWRRERPGKKRPRGLDEAFKADAAGLAEAAKPILDALKVTLETSLPSGKYEQETIDLLKDRFAGKLDLVLTPDRRIDTDDTYAKIVAYYNNYDIGVKQAE